MNYYELIQFLIAESLDRGIKPTTLIVDKLTGEEILKDSMTNIQHLDGSFVYSTKEIEDYVENNELKSLILFGVTLSIEQNSKVDAFNKIYIELK